MTLLQSLLRNVFDNAAKYSPNDGTVTVTTYQRAEMTIITVSNSGIADADIGRLGDRFYRHPQHQHLVGAGLGLSIVRHIVTLHGGQISFSVNSDGGLDVTITLPALKHLKHT